MSKKEISDKFAIMNFLTNADLILLERSKESRKTKKPLDELSAKRLEVLVTEIKGMGISGPIAAQYVRDRLKRECVLCSSHNIQPVNSMEQVKGIKVLFEHTHCYDCDNDFIDTYQIDANEYRLRESRRNQ